ncbi:MAG: diguanylate cyclase [Anaerolineales bacterium]|nr:diguanylate cyclase [Anaerolineales bacterium]
MSKANILIVEDEQIVAMDLQSSLEICGFSIVGQASRGDDAMQKVAELRPDLIMMDIGLKGDIDGIEAATQIRQQFNLPVIFLTAFANQSTVERARTAEPYGYILKPFEERELVVTIEMALYKHQAEKELIESEQKFHQVIDHASDGIALIDHQGHIIEWNAALEQITGLKNSDVIGCPIWEITFQMSPKNKKLKNPIETHALIWDIDIKGGYRNKDHVIEREIETPEGILRTIQSNGFSIETAQGMVGGVIIRDITEQRQTERKILEAQKQLEATFEAVPDLLFELGLDGRYYNYHTPRADLLAAPPEFFLGKTVAEVLPDEAAKVVYDALREAQEKGSSHGKQLELAVPSGKLWFELSVSRKVEILEQEPRFIVLSRDISDRKNLEQKERDQRMLAEALLDTAKALSGSLKLDDILDRILENLEKLVMHDVGIVLLVEENSVRSIRYQNTLKDPMKQLVLDHLQVDLINTPILSTILKTQEPLLINNLHKDARWNDLSMQGLEDIRSIIFAPIVSQGKVVGVINLTSSIVGFFTLLHVKRIMAFAAQVALAFENARLFEQVQHLALTDPLTDLFNMRYFEDYARLELERIQRYKRTLSIAMLDIDHFKNINDTFGHTVGDQVLRAISGRIKGAVRTVDIVARYGGEEFIILMPETNLDEAFEIGERVRMKITNTLIDVEENSIHITISAGVAEINTQANDLGKLIKLADQALYTAKQNGRNQVVKSH